MGNRIEIKNREDIEPGTKIICHAWSTPLLMPDNKSGVCSQCGRLIQHRPHVPADLVKICFECGVPAMLADAADGELHIVLTSESASELHAHIKKQRH
jgi:hypothetical protein